MSRTKRKPKVSETTEEKPSNKRVIVAFVRQGTKPLYAYMRSDKMPERIPAQDLDKFDKFYHRTEELLNENVYDFFHDNTTNSNWFVRRTELS